MPDFLDRLLGRTPHKKSGSLAKERLQFVLVHDRINLPPERMDEMKKEILAVISKYVSVDDEKVDIALQQRERASLLVAEIPFVKALEGIEQDDEEDYPPQARPEPLPQAETKPPPKPRAKPKAKPKDETTAAPE